MTTLLEEIRHHTKAQHEFLERNLDAVRLLGVSSTRLALLRRYLAVYGPAERALLPFLASIESLDFYGRCKAPALRRDLESLGFSAEECIRQDEAPPPRLRSRSHALGFAYVLEGATLGGRVIRKQLEKNGTSIDTLQFFDFYGGQAGERWREFCRVLEEECSDKEDTIAGARDGFAYVSDGLLALTLDDLTANT